MRSVKQPEELRFYGAQGKQLILRYQPTAISNSDSHCTAIELAIDVSGCGVGPYHTAHIPAALRLSRDDCEMLRQHLVDIHWRDEARSEPCVLKGEEGVSLSLRSGIERWTLPRPYTELRFEGVAIWPAPLSNQPDYRLYVWLYPEMLGRLIAALSDLLLPPQDRRVAVPLATTDLPLDHVEYAMGS